MKGKPLYDSKTKEHWRGWLWNDIREKFCPRLGPNQAKRILENKVGIYLPGPEDHDRRHARKRGFENVNLVAVDTVLERIENVRKAGGLGIHGKLNDVLLAWPNDWHIDLVVADYCWGFTKDFEKIGRILMHSCVISPNTVIAFNFLRGRDSSGMNWTRGAQEILRKFRASYQLYSKCEQVILDKYFSRPETHRSQIMVIQLLLVSIDLGIVTSLSQFIDHIRPSFQSYYSRDANQYFDSVVFRWPLNGNYTKYAGKDIRTQHTNVMNNLAREYGIKKLDRTRRKMAALRACRTMKIQSQ